MHTGEIMPVELCRGTIRAEFFKYIFYVPVYTLVAYRCVVLGMGDGSMTTLTIADPDKEGIRDYLKSLPSRNPPGCSSARGGNWLHEGRDYLRSLSSRKPTRLIQIQHQRR